MSGLFNFILVVFIIVMAFRIFFLNILPYLLKRKIEKMQDGYEHGQSHYERNNSKEGEVHFDKPDSNSRTAGKKNVGEYVDFEEID
ncbi:MAG: hypothetical protein WBG43_11830 [Marinifilaceae bacterium]